MKTKKGVSLRAFAHMAGINSSSFYKYIMEGERNLTDEAATKTCKALNLSAKETRYFKALVKFNQSTTLEEKDRYFKDLNRLRGKASQTIEEKRYGFYDKWYHCAVREAVCMPDFKGNFALAASKMRPPITEKQFRDSVNLLLELGFLSKTVHGGYKQQHPSITSGFNLRNFPIVKFQKEMLHKAEMAFDKSKRGSILMSSTTLGISEEILTELMDKIRDLRTELMEDAVRDTRPDRVYQLNLNFFPLYSPPDKESK